MSIKELLKGLKPTKEALIKGGSTALVIALCATSSLGVLQVINHMPNATVLADSETSAGTTVAESSVLPSETDESQPSETIEPTESSPASETSETETSGTTTTSQTTTETTIGESEFYLAVYATSTLNVRSGPGTEYDVVKQLNPGDQIDVIAITTNGWYKTYNGNYVSIQHTTDVAPTNTPTPTPRPTSASTTRSTTRATTRATTTTATAVAPTGEAISCRITFYGPQPNGDGTYSTSTATGTTCVQGRTCAADWSVFPAGSTIYIENDPLGGDGYYIVEDRGSAVKGHIIDIYVDDESGWNTTRRNVYAQ